MMISTKGRYALRVMIDLAEHNDTEYTAMKEVASRQDVSLKYLEKILPVLVSEGLIVGIHGKGGGYKLTRDPSEYRVGDILRLTEGSLSPVSCPECENGPNCPRASECRTLPMWKGLSEQINQYLDGFTLADLVKDSSILTS